MIEAIFAGEMDLGYIGPNPAINGYRAQRRRGAASRRRRYERGAALDRPPAGRHRGARRSGRQEPGRPQLGNTQDVALRAYLADHGLRPNRGRRNVQIIPTANPQILDLFRRGEIDGAWVPEPWATRLMVEGGGELFLDERDLWPNGEFTTAIVIARTAFLEAHPDLVQAWLEAHVELTLWEQANPDEAKRLANEAIGELTGAVLPQAVLDGAWSRRR